MKMRLSIALLILMPLGACKSKKMSGSVKSANVVSGNVVAGTGFFDFEASKNLSDAPNLVGELFSDDQEAQSLRSDMVGSTILDSLALDTTENIENFGFFLYVDSRSLPSAGEALRGLKTTFLVINSSGGFEDQAWSTFYQSYRSLKLSVAGKIEPRLPVQPELVDKLDDFPWADSIEEGSGAQSKRVKTLRVAKHIDPSEISKATVAPAGNQGPAAASTGRHILVEKLFTLELKQASRALWDYSNIQPEQKIYLVALVRDGDDTIQGVEVLAMPRSWTTDQIGSDVDAVAVGKVASPDSTVQTSTPIPASQSSAADVAAATGTAKAGSKIVTKLKVGVSALRIRNEPNTKTGRVLGAVTRANGGQVTIDPQCVKSGNTWCWFEVKEDKISGYIYSKYVVDGRRADE